MVFKIQATGPYSELAESNQNPQLCLFNPFDSIISSTSSSSTCYLTFRVFFSTKLYVLLILSLRATRLIHLILFGLNTVKYYVTAAWPFGSLNTQHTSDFDV
jgi:hypothetical protein